MEIVRQLAGRIIPAVCFLCGAEKPRSGLLCRGCLTDLPRTRIGCPVCGVEQSTAIACGRCQRRPPPYDCVITAYRYTAPIDRLIWAFKFQHTLLAGRALTPALAERVRMQCRRPPQAMIPVPLHWRRLYRRGFNQSLEIARDLQRSLAVDIDTRLVRRRRATREQARLAPKERRRNLRKAFALRRIREEIESVAIVDDVITTGTTVAELAWLLRQAGVKEIHVWALARAQ